MSHLLKVNGAEKVLRLQQVWSLSLPNSPDFYICVEWSYTFLTHVSVFFLLRPWDHTVVRSLTWPAFYFTWHFLSRVKPLREIILFKCSMTLQCCSDKNCSAHGTTELVKGYWLRRRCCQIHPALHVRLGFVQGFFWGARGAGGGLSLYEMKFIPNDVREHGWRANTAGLSVNMARRDSTVSGCIWWFLNFLLTECGFRKLVSTLHLGSRQDKILNHLTLVLANLPYFFG